MVNLAHYPQSLVLLMKTNGTVTDLLATLTNESIGVTKHSEQIVQAAALSPSIIPTDASISAQERVLQREICLVGSHSQTAWVYATSEIFLDRLSSAMVDDLLNHAIPIGTIWRNLRMETYKTPLTQWADAASSRQCATLGLSQPAQVLGRRYAVYNQGRIIMLISEVFPLQRFTSITLT